MADIRFIAHAKGRYTVSKGSRVDSYDVMRGYSLSEFDQVAEITRDAPGGWILFLLDEAGEVVSDEGGLDLRTARKRAIAWGAKVPEPSADK